MSFDILKRIIQVALRTGEAWPLRLVIGDYLRDELVRAVPNAEQPVIVLAHSLGIALSHEMFVRLPDYRFRTLFLANSWGADQLLRELLRSHEQSVFGGIEKAGHFYAKNDKASGGRSDMLDEIYGKRIVQRSISGSSHSLFALLKHAQAQQVLEAITTSPALSSAPAAAPYKKSNGGLPSARS